MCSFRSLQTRFEFLSQFRKVRNTFECFVKTKCVWPMKINVICTVYDDTCPHRRSATIMDMRNSALVTGSNWFGALGLETPAEQKKYFSKVYSHTWT